MPPAPRRRRRHAFRSGLQSEQAGRGLRDQEADEGRGHDDQGKRQVEEEDADEGRARQRQQQPGLQRPAPDSNQRFDHDHQHGGLDSEQRAIHDRDAATEHVEQAEGEHDQRARQYEQDAGGKPAAGAVQQPPGIGRELLRFRARQQHAEVERVQVARLVDPLLLVDENAVHQRDLAGRAPETDAADLQPNAPSLAERRGICGRRFRRVHALQVIPLARGCAGARVIRARPRRRCSIRATPGHSHGGS